MAGFDKFTGKKPIPLVLYWRKLSDFVYISKSAIEDTLPCGNNTYPCYTIGGAIYSISNNDTNKLPTGNRTIILC